MKSFKEFLNERSAPISNKQSYEDPRIVPYAKVNRFKDIQQMIENGADVNYISPSEENRTALYWASRRGYKGLVQLLLDNGAEVNTKNDFGSTPLHGACLHSEEDDAVFISKLLINSGANVNAKNNSGETPLSLAFTVHDFGELSAYLESKGAKR